MAPPLVGDRDQGGPGRSGHAGAAHRIPWAPSRVVVRVVHRNSREREELNSDIGDRPESGVRHGLLVSGLALEEMLPPLDHADSPW